MGERTLRRLLIIGSSAVVLQASKRGAPKGSWLEQMLARKPRMLVTVALANKTARIVWALLVKKRKLQSSGRGGVSPRGPEVVAGVVGRRRVWRNSRRDGIGRTRCTTVPRARIYDLVPVRELPYRPAAPSLHQRPDRWQHPTTWPILLKNRLHLAGRPQMSSRPNWHLLQTGGFSGRPRVISNRHVIDAS